MSKVKEFFKSPHIQISYATGTSIIILAIVSSRILPEPMGYLALAIPPFFATIFESLLGSRYKESKICTTRYWIVAIFIATIAVIGYHLT